MTSHTEMCEQSAEGCEVTSVEEGHDVEFENYAKDSQEAKVEELQNTEASLSGSLTKSKEELASVVTSAAETAKEISSLHQSCDWLLQNFDTRRTAQNGEIVEERIRINSFTSKILKLSLWIQILTLSCTMSVSLQFERNPVLLKEFKTALEKKGLGRKTNHQDLMKIETEEIFVLTKATVGALKLEQSAKAVEAQEKAEALPRPARPPPWRDKFRACQSGSEVEEERTAETEVQCCVLQPCAKARGYKPRRGEEIPPLFGPPRTIPEALRKWCRRIGMFI